MLSLNFSELTCDNGNLTFASLRALQPAVFSFQWPAIRFCHSQGYIRPSPSDNLTARFLLSTGLLWARWRFVQTES